jgi:hypothetical protein
MTPLSLTHVCPSLLSTHIIPAASKTSTVSKNRTKYRDLLGSIWFVIVLLKHVIWVSKLQYDSNEWVSKLRYDSNEKQRKQARKKKREIRSQKISLKNNAGMSKKVNRLENCPVHQFNGLSQTHSQTN